MNTCVCVCACQLLLSNLLVTNRLQGHLTYQTSHLEEAGTLARAISKGHIDGITAFQTRWDSGFIRNKKLLEHPSGSPLVRLRARRPPAGSEALAADASALGHPRSWWSRSESDPTIRKMGVHSGNMEHLSFYPFHGPLRWSTNLNWTEPASALVSKL